MLQKKMMNIMDEIASKKVKEEAQPSIEPRRLLKHK
jgi:hypothetical protein